MNRYDEARIAQARTRVVALARAMLRGEVGVLEGSRRMTGHRWEVGVDEWDDDMLTFVSSNRSKTTCRWAGSASTGIRPRSPAWSPRPPAPRRSTARRRWRHARRWSAASARSRRRNDPHPPTFIAPYDAVNRSGAMPGVLYDTIGRGYAPHRRPDARIAARVAAALGDAGSVVNVGAGAGSYEPAGRRVAAVEPSGVMVRQRAAGTAPAVRAVAGALPFRDGAFDAALGVLTLHHWPDWRRGVAEMRRVARARVVILTWDPDHPGFWLTTDYFPTVIPADRAAFPRLADLAAALGGASVRPVPVPADCTDGFLGAYWRRPAAYLDPGVRGAISALARIPDPAPALARLAADLADGSWERRWAHLPADEMDLGYRLVVADGG